MKNESRIMEEKAKIKSFTDLIAWKEGHVLAILVYSLTKDFPKEEIYGLVSQIRRSAVSITSNIAEGFSRNTYKDKVQFYSIAQGSVTELQSQLLTARDIGYIKNSDFNKLANQTIIINKLINGLIKKSKTFNS